MCRILGRLGKDRALALFPSDPAASAPFVVSELTGWEPKGILFFRAFSTQPHHAAALQGGCAWIAGPDKSRSGKPLMSCALYQTLTAPGFWYRARLIAGDFHLSGAFIPGAPVAIAGSNNKVSWGCVPAPGDDADLFVEKLDSDHRSYGGSTAGEKQRKSKKITA